MEKIMKNGKEFLRFKIGDEFQAFSSRTLTSKISLNQYYKGDITFNAMLKAGIVSKKYSQDFPYPFMDSSTQNNHIKGYSRIKNFSGKAIKVSESGDAGKTVLIDGDYFIGRPSYLLISKNMTNEFMEEFLSFYLPKYKQTSVLSNLMYSYIDNNIIEIPSNHNELAKIIKRILKYQQLSKQLSKQLHDYKKAILQKASQEIEMYKSKGEYDKYISFKIGDEFTAISGKGSFNKMKNEGLASDEYDEENGFIYPVYDASQSNNHLKGWTRYHNIEGPMIKVSKTGNGIYKNNELDPTPAGASVFIANNAFLCDASLALKGKFTNEFTALFMNKFIPRYEQGTNGLHNVYFSSIRNEIIDIPKNNNELSQIIKQINTWEELINKTTKKMNMYIDGVLQLSLKGAKNE